MSTFDLRTHARDRLQQIDLMSPRLTRRLDRRIDLRRRQVDPLQAVQNRSGQLGVVGVEVPLQRPGQIRDLATHLALGHLRQQPCVGLPSIIVANIARAEVCSDDATVESLIDASSSISSSRTGSRVRFV